MSATEPAPARFLMPALDYLILLLTYHVSVVVQRFVIDLYLKYMTTLTSALFFQLPVGYTSLHKVWRSKIHSFSFLKMLAKQ